MYIHLSLDSSADESGDEWLHDNGLISGSLRAHKMYCPMNSTNRSSCVLFDADNAVPVHSPDRVESDDSMECPGKKSGDDVGFKPGDCAQWAACRIIQVV